jgi:hypothetical protein
MKITPSKTQPNTGLAAFDPSQSNLEIDFVPTEGTRLQPQVCNPKSSEALNHEDTLFRDHCLCALLVNRYRIAMSELSPFIAQFQTQCCSVANDASGHQWT